MGFLRANAGEDFPALTAPVSEGRLAIAGDFLETDAASRAARGRAIRKRPVGRGPRLSWCRVQATRTKEGCDRVSLEGLPVATPGGLGFVRVRCQISKGVDCLTKDREALLTFFDFPAEHWDHLRTSNPIESVFATVRHRTVRAKGALSHKTARLMVFKLVMSAAKTWRRLKGENQLPMVIAGVKFTNGVAQSATPDHRAA